MNGVFVKKEINDGIRVFVNSTDKFKTITVKVFVHQNLQEETVTKTALIPFVLKRGCEFMPTSQEITTYLENLYGAGFDVDIIKKGERQIIEFDMDVVNDKFLPPNTEGLLEKGLQALKEIMMNPLLENGGFNKTYFEQEKDVLLRNIKDLFNNKRAYAVERCFQEMCRDERFSLYKYGKEEDLEDLDPVELYGYYNEILKHNPIDVFVMGDVDVEKVFETAEKMFKYPRGNIKAIPPTLVDKKVEKEKTVIEKQKVNQGKLSLGLRTYTVYGDYDYYPLLVCNGILGGGVHSKLFQNVREKASLAYYVFSRIEKLKGVMVIASGIEFKDYDKTLDITKKQILDLKNGVISDYEMSATKKMIISSLKEVADNPMAAINLYLDGVIAGKIEEIDDMIKNIEKVTKQEVVEAANKLKLDTVYFLTQE